MKTYQFLAATVFLALNPSASGKDPIKATIDKSGEFQRYVAVSNSDETERGSGALRMPRWHAHDGYERIVLDFQLNGEVLNPREKTEPLKTPPNYKVEHDGVPDVVVITYGSRVGPRLDFGEFAKKSKLVRHAYRLPLMDDATAALAIGFKEEVEIEVFELHDPARLVIDARKVKEPETNVVYAARTKSFRLDAVEEVARLAERLRAADDVARPRQLLTADGKGWCLQLGISRRDWKAQIHCAGFGEELEKMLFVEKRKRATDAPAREFVPVKPSIEE